MLILTATNVTQARGKQALVKEDGTADYEVWLGINHHCIYKGPVNCVRTHDSAPQLLRAIANKVEVARVLENSMPIMTRFLKDFLPEPSQELLDKCRLDLFAALDAGIHTQKGRSTVASVERRIKRIVRARVKLEHANTEGKVPKLR